MTNRVTLLVTAFGPFGEHTDNPSEGAVAGLRSLWTPPDGVRLVTEVLPVSFERATARIAELQTELRPDVLLSVGLAAGRARLGIERVALNLADAPIPDADGAQPADVPVIDTGDTALLTTLPAKRIVAALRAAGVPAEVSLSAGSYVCNATMYAGLAHANAGSRAGFVHVPAADVLPVAEASRALAVVLETILDDAAQPEEPGTTIASGGRLH